MVRANVDVEGGVANGATGVYEGRDAATGQARVRLGARTLLIAPHVWEGEAEGYALAYRQTPLVPAWGLTIHKAQGQQFENVFVDFGDFARWPDASKLVGMAYVAVSRVTAPEGFSQRGYRRCFVVADAAANAFYARA
jgi:ATP-dependent DNA helicase PIF1